MFVVDSKHVWLILALGSVLGSAGCSKPAPPAPAASASASASASARRPALVRHRPTPPPMMPVGQRLGLVPGTGVGPVMFGATVQTIERLMAVPCDVKTAERCRYFAQALDFDLEDGVLVRIHAYRRERPAGEDATGQKRTFGVFFGGIPADPGAGRSEGVAFGMHAAGVAAGLGAPQRVEKVSGQNPTGTVERHYHDGVILEYDVYEGTQVPVVGRITLVPNEAAKQTIAKEKAKLAGHP